VTPPRRSRRASRRAAGPIHFGWAARRIQPQPFIYEAVDRRRKEIRDRYEKLVDDLIKKHDLEDKRSS
jgi:hypothetical protein